MSIVVDSSAIIALAMDDEDASYAHHLLDALADEQAYAPVLLWYEVRNVLIVNERRGRINQQQVEQFLLSLQALPILSQAPEETLTLTIARNHQLTVYDAAYLELAMRQRARLATLDKSLIRAAKFEEIELFTI